MITVSYLSDQETESLISPFKNRCAINKRIYIIDTHMFMTSETCLQTISST